MIQLCKADTCLCESATDRLGYALKKPKSHDSTNAEQHVMEQLLDYTHVCSNLKQHVYVRLVESFMAYSLTGAFMFPS